VARAYHQNCPIAKGLDVLGERWTLLILRELIGGARRYADLRAALFADPKGEHAEKFFQLPSDAAERIDAQVGFIWSQACTGKFVWPLPDKGLKKHIHRIAAPTLIVWGKADGIIAINIRDDDELLAVRAVDPDDEIIMVSRAGLTVRFAESDARAMGRDTTGVRGMDVGKDGRVIAMDVARDDMDLLVVTENGYGKRTQISQYRKTNRGAKGVKTIGLTEQKGGLAGALVVREHQELVFISVGGMVQRTAAGGISRQGRSATGVRVMNLKDDDAVSAIALVVEGSEEVETAQEEAEGSERAEVETPGLDAPTPEDNGSTPLA